MCHAAASTRFHELLVELSGNGTLAVVSGMLHEIIEAQIDQAVAANSDERPGTFAARNRQAGVKPHAKPMRLLGDGDGAAAEAFWRTHMDAAGQIVLREIGPKSVVDLMG